MNNGISKDDFGYIHWDKDSGGSEKFELIIHGESKQDCEKKKQIILNNQAIVKALQDDLKETEEYFIETKDDVQRRILDYHSVMINAVLNTTLHSNGFGGKNYE